MAKKKEKKPNLHQSNTLNINVLQGQNHVKTLTTYFNLEKTNKLLLMNFPCDAFQVSGTQKIETCFTVATISFRIQLKMQIAERDYSF